MLKRGDRCEYLHYTLPCASSLITLSDGAESPDTRPRISALDLGTIAQPGTAKLNMAEDMITDDVQVSNYLQGNYLQEDALKGIKLTVI